MTASPDIQTYERTQIAKHIAESVRAKNSAVKGGGKAATKATEKSVLPDFRAGDSLRVQVRIREGSNERLQAFEGVCIARHNAGLGSSFTVRKRSYGEGVERIFPLYSPNIAEIEVVQRGQVRRAKLYYLRERQGKKARIAEDMTRTREDRANALKEKNAQKDAQKNAGENNKENIEQDAQKD